MIYNALYQLIWSVMVSENGFDLGRQVWAGAKARITAGGVANFRFGAVRGARAHDYRGMGCLAALMVADGGGGPVCVLYVQALFRWVRAVGRAGHEGRYGGGGRACAYVRRVAAAAARRSPG